MPHRSSLRQSLYLRVQSHKKAHRILPLKSKTVMVPVSWLTIQANAGYIFYFYIPYTSLLLVVLNIDVRIYRKEIASSMNQIAVL
jgi:hypothetical protein